MGGRGAYYERSAKENTKATMSEGEAKEEFKSIIKSGVSNYRKAAFEAGFLYDGNENDKRHSIEGVKFNLPEKMKKQESEEDSVKAIAGPDLTKGSCASAALSFIMRRGGYDVTDFRGGQSRNVFSNGSILSGIAALGDTKQIFKGNQYAAAHQLLKGMEPNKQYLLVAGAHAAIVKKEKDYYYYLELQDRYGRNGWKPLGGSKRASDVDVVLYSRFGAKKSKCPRYSTLTSIDSLMKNEKFQHLTSFLNTKGMKQYKGDGGHVK